LCGGPEPPTRDAGKDPKKVGRTPSGGNGGKKRRRPPQNVCPEKGGPLGPIQEGEKGVAAVVPPVPGLKKAPLRWRKKKGGRVPS